LLRSAIVLRSDEAKERERKGRVTHPAAGHNGHSPTDDTRKGGGMELDAAAKRPQVGATAAPSGRLAMSPDDSILVTGAGGFIGGHIMAALKARGFTRIRAVDIKPVDTWYQRIPGVETVRADLREMESCRQVTDHVAWIFNLAADMGGMGFIEANKAACMLSVVINTNLLLAARDQAARGFFFSSSACVYNGQKQDRVDATALREEDAYPALPEDGYGWEKLFSERMCRHFTEDFGLPTRVARYHNVYGPLGTWEGGREKAPAAICRKVVQAKLSGSSTIEIWGDGEQTRSFTYIDDCVEGTLRIFAGASAEPLNLGSAELVSINQLVTMAEDIAGVRLNRAYNLGAPKGVRGRNSDNKRILETLGWEPSTSLRYGLERTYAWIYTQLNEGLCDRALSGAAQRRGSLDSRPTNSSKRPALDARPPHDRGTFALEMARAVGTQQSAPVDL
jgi:GDP-D-mannose 3',5'-epimerase